MLNQLILNLSNKTTNIEITQDTEILGLFIGKNMDKIDSILNIIHTKPNLKSNTRIKAVLYNKSQFNLLGNIIINTGAIATDAYLRIDVLLLGENSKAKVIPSLEIMESDVQGGHGATVSKINKSHLFYLQSRGLSEVDSQSLIIDGFIGEIKDKIDSIQNNN